MRDFDLRELQLKELELLKGFDAFCAENDIVYFLDGGTLLGAVRHQGFIPWDDDIDVCMDVKNYRKLLRLAHKLPKPLFFQNLRTDPLLPNRWGKIRMDGTTCMTASMSALDSHWGVGMDVFPQAGLARTGLGRRLQRAAIALLDALLYKPRALATAAPLSRPQRFLYAVLPEPVRRLLARCAERAALLDTRHSRQTFSFYYSADSERYLMPASMFDADNRIMLPFEDAVFPCPKDYDEMLTVYYGDWRAVPPAGEQIDHGDIIVDLEHDWRTYYTGKRHIRKRTAL